jgi:hypothetical protein
MSTELANREDTAGAVWRIGHPPAPLSPESVTLALLADHVVSDSPALARPGISAGQIAVCQNWLKEWRRARDSNPQGPRGPVDFKFLKSGRLSGTIGNDLKPWAPAHLHVVTVGYRSWLMVLAQR